MRWMVFLVVLMWAAVCIPLSGKAESGDAIEQPSDYQKDKPWRKKEPEKAKKKKRKTSDAKKYRLMARDLLGTPHWSERFMGLLDQDVPRIAIHPFEAEDLPISREEAQIYVDGFTRALIRAAGDRYAVVGREELGAVVSDINEMGARSDSINPLGDLISRARSDLLAVGSLSLKTKKIVLSYKLVETETGRIVSATQRSFTRKPPSEEGKTLGGLSLQGAVQKAAQALLRDTGPMRKIMVQGVRYQTSGIHTSFGRYFTGLLVDVLRQRAASGPRNINDLDISDFVVEEETFRGLQLAKGTVEQSVLRRGDGGAFILKGTYWPFEDYVEVRLSLESEQGSSVAWRGRLIKSEIPAELELVPPPAPVDAENNKPLGPIDLYLSSNKGDNPSFKIGQEMVLSVRTGKDAYLGCYYLQADGRIFRIFPNRFIQDAKLNGGFIQRIPSAAMPFAFEFTPPSGVEAVKCFATDRDVAGDIVPSLGKAAFTPINIANERQLTKVYRSLTDVVLSEATLIVSVE